MTLKGFLAAITLPLFFAPGARADFPSADGGQLEPLFEPQAFCPEVAEVGGEIFAVDIVAPDLGEVALPAANGCEGKDTFRFQCRFRSPNATGEGEWVPAETVGAPGC